MFSLIFSRSRREGATRKKNRNEPLFCLTAFLFSSTVTHTHTHTHTQIKRTRQRWKLVTIHKDFTYPKENSKFQENPVKPGKTR